MKHSLVRLRSALLTFIVLLSMQNALAGPTDITILNNDGAGEGFNDTTDT